jgi:hypothetical protein
MKVLVYRPAAPVLWNSLPDNYRNCSNFNEFKNLISFWNGKSSTCIHSMSKFLVICDGAVYQNFQCSAFYFFILFFSFALSFYLCHVHSYQACTIKL